MTNMKTIGGNIYIGRTQVLHCLSRYPTDQISVRRQRRGEKVVNHTNPWIITQKNNGHADTKTLRRWRYIVDRLSTDGAFGYARCPHLETKKSGYEKTNITIRTDQSPPLAPRGVTLMVSSAPVRSSQVPSHPPGCCRGSESSCTTSSSRPGNKQQEHKTAKSGETYLTMWTADIG